MDADAQIQILRREATALGLSEGSVDAIVFFNSLARLSNGRERRYGIY